MLQDSANFNGYSPLNDTTYELLVGRCNHLNPFMGYLHDFRYYARQLSSGEIKAIYETERHLAMNFCAGFIMLEKVVSYGGNIYGKPIQVNSAGGHNGGDVTTGLPAPKKVLWDPEPEQTRFNNYTAMVPSFNGSSQYLEIPYNAGLNTPKFTVTCWLYTTGGAGTWRSAFTSRHYTGGATQGYMLYVSQSDQYQFSWGDGDGNWEGIQSSTSDLVLNQWTHLTIQHDGTTRTCM